MTITAGQTIASGQGSNTTANHSVMNVAAATVANLAKTGVVTNYLRADAYKYFERLGLVDVKRPATWGLQFNTAEVSKDGAVFGMTEFADGKMSMPSVGVEGYITPVKAGTSVIFSDTEMLREAKQGEEYFKTYVAEKYTLQGHMLAKKIQNQFLTEVLNKAFDSGSDYTWDSRALISASHAYTNGVTYNNLINLPVTTDAEVETAFDTLRARVADLSGSDGYPLGGRITDVIVKKGSALAKRVRKLAQVADSAAFAAGIVTAEGAASVTLPTTSDDINIYSGTFNVVEVTGFNDSELLAFDRTAMKKPIVVIVTQDITAGPMIDFLNGSIGYHWTWFGEFGIVNEPNTVFGIKDVGS